MYCQRQGKDIANMFEAEKIRYHFPLRCLKGIRVGQGCNSPAAGIIFSNLRQITLTFRYKI
ncbi:hypothetical protein DMTZ50_1219 [Dehalococcoides mccartyi]|uniref:Uncharacterized protein n=1 Tax=Dehalococcoides mccartyi TaxID=61435 RepID=A0A142VAM2_9CHLR|nr:hypothetical protein Dm11a5_0996 [Dehalococcoides mccartyi]AOV99611.1 hypothetical protein DCWBC2_0984 [Dehalococcoides mccartyi]MBA2085390.1 hypothetical protein [Dehalococcoides mccartyi]